MIAAERPERRYTEQINRAMTALRAMDSAVVVFEDARVGYVEVQIDREAWLAWKERNPDA